MPTTHGCLVSLLIILKTQILLGSEIYNANLAVPVKDILVNSTLIEDAANFGTNVVNYLSVYSCCTYRESLANIDDKSKVINDTVFPLTISIGTSFCGNSDIMANVTDCALQPGMQHRECNVTVFNLKKEHTFQIKSVSCEPKGYPNEISDDIEVYSPTMQSAAGYAMNEINYENGYSPFHFRQQLAKLDHATSEVLDGGYYNLMMHLGPSICPNLPIYNNATTQQCPLQPGMPLQSCNATVVFRPWAEQPYSLSQHICSTDTTTLRTLY